MPDPNPTCLYCGITSDQIPLVSLFFNGTPYWICPQHLPILIHQPAKLAGKLPGIENITGLEDAAQGH